MMNGRIKNKKTAHAVSGDRWGLYLDTRNTWNILFYIIIETQM